MEGQATVQTANLETELRALQKRTKRLQTSVAVASDVSRIKLLPSTTTDPDIRSTITDPDIFIPPAKAVVQVRRPNLRSQSGSFGGLGFGDGQNKSPTPIAPHKKTGTINCQPRLISTATAIQEMSPDDPLSITREFEKKMRATRYATAETQAINNPNLRRGEIIIRPSSLKKLTEWIDWTVS